MNEITPEDFVAVLKCKETSNVEIGQGMRDVCVTVWWESLKIGTRYVT
jgi:hypothetical protein